MSQHTHQQVLTNELVIDYRIKREVADIALNNGQRSAYHKAQAIADAVMLCFNEQDWHVHTSTPWDRRY